MIKSLPLTKWLSVIVLVLALAVNGQAQTTYTWNQTADAAFSTSTNWTPERTTPANTDILVFNNGGTYNVTGVATQTIGQLLVSNNSKVTLQASAATQTLTIAGGAGTDLDVASGSELNINMANALTIALSTGATGSVSGGMTFAAGAHKLIPADASGVTFNSGSSFTCGTGFSSNPFGTSTTAVANSVIFASGSTFVFMAGSNPFALTAPASAVIFQTGSTYVHKSTNTPSVANRVFSNFELNIASGSVSVSGTTPFTMDNLTVTSGTLNVNMTGTGTGANIKGNITVVSGATLTFTPASAGNVTFSGSSAQSITGSVTAAANATIVLNQDLVIAGSLTANGNVNLGTRTISGAGSLTIGSGSTVTTANSYGLDAAQNLTVTTLTNNALSYVYNGSVAQVTGALLPATITNLNINNTSTGGVSLTSDENISGALTCTAGVLKLGSKNLVIASGKNITATYNSYVVTDGTGTLTHTLAASTNPLYGFGTASGFAPVLCSVSAAGSGNVVAGSVKPTITHAPLHSNKVVQQEWIFNETVTGTDAGTVSFGWNNTTAAGSEFDVTKPVVFASWNGVKYNMDDVTPVAGTNGMYTITVDLPTNIPNTPLLVGNKSAFQPDAPALTADATDNNVDNDITITFTDDATWRTAVTAASVNGTALTPTTDYTLEAGILTLKPSGGNTLLTTSGTKTVSLSANGYNDATVSQIINAGAINTGKSSLAISAPLAAGSASTVTLTAKDNYGNLITGYIFKADITLTDAVGTIDESYTVNGTGYTSTATDVALPATVNGVTTFDISVPAAVDGGDGISVQVQLNDGTTNFGSALSYSAPLVPSLTIGVATALTEANLGTESINITLLNDTFVDNILDKANVTLNNAPSGVAVTGITWVSATSATLAVSYDGTDFDANITNFSVSIAAAELTAAGTLTSNTLTITATVETVPVVTTNTAITSLGMFTAAWGGEATADGGEAITEKGICWSNSANPTTANSKTTEGAGTGTIAGTMTDLLQGTKYYVRAYATNSVGTGYGDEYNFTTNAAYEDFVNFPETSTSYKDGSFTGRDGSTWSYVKCAGTATTQITAPSPVLAKNATLANVTSGTIPNGVSTLTFKYVQAFSSSVNLDVYVNTTKVGNVTTVSESAMATVHTVTIPVFISGNVVLKFIQNSSTSGQVTIDDIAWTPYVSDGNTVAAPRFSPLPGASIGSQSVTITCETADATIYYTTDGTEPTSASTPYTTAINLTSTTTIKAIAVKAGMTDSPVMSGTYNVESITDVATIIDLRAGTVGSLYRLTGEGIVTYVTSTQKFIQDAGAGIVIYDATGIITTSVNQYDGIKNITGRLYSYSGVLELLPITGYSTVTVSSTANSVTPIPITVADLNAGPSTYESRLIKITGLTFADANGTAKFVGSTATNYNVSDGTNTTIFRTAFSAADYVGTVIPAKADIVGLGMQYNGTAQFAARNLADFTIYSSAKAITAFAFNGLTPAVTATINETDKTIAATVPTGTSRTALVPTITVSANATVSPLSGVAADFTSPVTYTVTAQDGTTQAYTVTVSVASGIDSETEANVKVGPVPATTELRLLNVESVIQIEIYNVAGLKISSSKHDNESFISVPVSGYAPGLYFIRFTTAEGTFMKKFIKQ